MEESKSNKMPKFEFPVDLSTLINFQFDSLKIAIEYLGRQQERLNGDIYDIRTLALGEDPGHPEKPGAKENQPFEIPPLEIKGDNNFVDILSFNNYITQIIT